MTLELVAAVDPNLDQEEIFALLMAHDGNITKAAKELKIDPIRLRAYVRAVPALRRAMEETLEQGVDEAVDVIFEALRDKSSFQNRYYAAKELLRSEAGRRRGFGREASASVSVELKAPERGGIIAIKWLEPPEEEK